MSQIVRVKEFLPGGLVMLEDDRVMQAVIAPSGSLGVRSVTREDAEARGDRYITPPGDSPTDAVTVHDQAPLGNSIPSLRSLGLDQG